MHLRSCVGALAAILALCSLSVAGEGFRPVLNGKEPRRDAPRATNGLALSIRADKAEYGPDEPITLDVKLTNVTGGRPGMKARNVHVYFDVLARTPRGRLAEWLLKIEARDETTKKVVYRSPDFKVPVADRRDYYHFVTLPPRAFVGRSFKFPSRLLTPGRRYSFVVSYIVSGDYPYVIRNRDFTTEQVELLGIKVAYVRIWTGRLVSNRAVFRIKPKTE